MVGKRVVSQPRGTREMMAWRTQDAVTVLSKQNLQGWVGGGCGRKKACFGSENQGEMTSRQRCFCEWQYFSSSEEWINRILTLIDVGRESKGNFSLLNMLANEQTSS